MPFASLLFRKPRLNKTKQKENFCVEKTEELLYFYIVRHTIFFLRGAFPMGTGPEQLGV